MRSDRLRRVALAAAGLAASSLIACANGASEPGATADVEPVAPVELEARAAISASPLARVLSRDERSAARLLRAAPRARVAAVAKLTREVAARMYLAHHAALLGLLPDVVEDAVVDGAQGLAGGAGLVQFSQRVAGVEVFRARATVMLDAKQNVTSIASSLAPAATRGRGLERFVLTAESALARAYGERAGQVVPSERVRVLGAREDAWSDYAIAAPEGAPRVLEAAAKRVAFAEGDALEPAYHVEILTRAIGSSENQLQGYVISARDGRILQQHDLTASEAFTYRVWADPSGLHTPADGPLVDATPHPSGVPDRVRPDFASPILVTTEGFNTSPSGAPDPWLAANATYTFGNNVSAYSDRNQSRLGFGNGYTAGDVRADLTGPRTFDRTYDVTRAPSSSTDQIKAAVTQIFYTVNWLHDYFYDSGFTESARNAQVSNYGRGGAGNDPVLAEVQDSADSGARDNANMSTPSDGRSPRMQMYVWSGVPNVALTTSPAVAFTDGLTGASFGQQTFDLSSQGLPLKLVNDGSTAIPQDGSPPGAVTDACQALVGSYANTIAVMDRGGCNFTVKVANAQRAGARAVVLVNNAPGNMPVTVSGSDTSIRTPTIGVSREQGAALKALLARATVTAPRFYRGAEVLRDGTIDNSIVAHEWGHYIHHRLVSCSSLQCGAMSEGWGDFIAVFLALREGDTFGSNVYPLAQYATGGGVNAAYYGIRRAPYSTDFGKNPLTFKHVRRASPLPTTAPLAGTGSDNAEVHNAGEIWAEALFTAYAELLEAGAAAGRPFAVSQRRMADYVVAGMRGAPVEPTFTEQRDAILASVLAMAEDDPSRAEDFAALARGFAARGLGARAVSPPIRSTTLNEAVESFEVQSAAGVRGAQASE